MEGGHEQCIVQRVAQQLCVRAVQTYRKERFEQPQESPFWEGQPLKGWYQITTNKTGCPPLVRCFIACLISFSSVCTRKMRAPSGLGARFARGGPASKALFGIERGPFLVLTSARDRSSEGPHVPRSTVHP